MKHFLKVFALASFALLTANSAAAQSARGEYQGIGFTAQVSFDQQWATIYWDDGAASVSLPYNPNPTPRLRCPCRAFEAYPRKLVIFYTDGAVNRAEYERLDRRPVSNSIPVPAGAMCTRDLNRWGNPSHCQCPRAYQYNQRTRRCDRSVLNQLPL